MRTITLILLAIASFFLIAMLKRMEWLSLANYLLRVGYYWPLLFVPYGLSNLLGAISWKFILVRQQASPSLGRLFILRLAGESLNQLTPTASMGGEPFKAFRLNSVGVSWQDATASLIILKGMSVLSLVLYIFAGIALAPFFVPEETPHLAEICLGAAVFAAAGLVFVIVQRSNPCAFLISRMKKYNLCPAFIRNKEAELVTLDSCLAGFYREHSLKGLAVFVLLFLSWLLQTVEVYLIFRILGHHIDWGTALCLDALAMLITSLGFMIPVALGVQDGGNILLAIGFNLGATLGAAFSIIRRFREAFWLLLGLLVVAREK